MWCELDTSLRVVKNPSCERWNRDIFPRLWRWTYSLCGNNTSDICKLWTQKKLLEWSPKLVTVNNSDSNGSRSQIWSTNFGHPHYGYWQMKPGWIGNRRVFQKFPDWPPGARTVNGTALCHQVQLYRYFMSQYSEFCRHDTFMLFLNECYCYCCLFRYRLSPETFGYTLVYTRTRQGQIKIWQQENKQNAGNKI
jgi:hypothetical protein